MDKYHEMMMKGSEIHIQHMKMRAVYLRRDADLAIKKAELLENEAWELEKMRDNWAKALKALGPAA